MLYVYVLQSLKNNSLYIGYTNNIKRRILEHNRQENLSTKAYAPWKLIFFEGYLEEKDAQRREKYLKTNQGSRLLKRMLKEYLFNNK
ncbi:MAG: GIY-YIG nuclease family protein [Patescibacteria group bacterium]|nr:GIY-YIG nuclease family protein [Patescibacteria group bacterium]